MQPTGNSIIAPKALHHPGEKAPEMLPNSRHAVEYWLMAQSVTGSSELLMRMRACVNPMCGAIFTICDTERTQKPRQ